MNLYKLGFKNYTALISLDNGRSWVSSINHLCKTAEKAAEYAIAECKHRYPAATLLIYHYPVIERMPWEPPNRLELVIDYDHKNFYLVPWPLHAHRTAPRWRQPNLPL